MPLFRLGYLFLFIIIGGYYAYTLSLVSNVLTSVKMPELYTDQEEGGMSKAWLETVEGLKFSYILNKNVAYPYVGDALADHWEIV